MIPQQKYRATEKAAAAAAITAALALLGAAAWPVPVYAAQAGGVGNGAAGTAGGAANGTTAPGGTAAPIGSPSASPATPQTPGTATAPGTSAGAAPGLTAAPVAGQAPGAAGGGGNNGVASGPATAVSSFSGGGAGGDNTTGANGVGDAGAANTATNGGNGNETLGGSIPGHAMAPDNPNFDLARTVQAALASSAQLDLAKRNVRIDQKRTDEAEAGERPNVTGTGSATRFDNKTVVAFGGQAFEVIGYHTETLSLAVNQRIDLLGDVRATRSQLKLQEAADRYSVDQIVNQRVLQANTMYFDLLRAIHQVQVAQAALRNAQEQQTIANRLYLGQIGQKIDVLRADTEVSQAEQNLTAAINQRDVAQQSFNDLVGRPLTAPVTLLDTPGVTVGVDLPASATTAPVGTTPTTNGTADFTTPFTPPMDELNAINIDQTVNTALTIRPEILQNTVRVREAETGIRIARFGQEPVFALSASGNYYPTTSFETPRQRTAALTATVTIPFYDGGATRARIDEAKLERQNAQTTLESAQTDVSLQVRQAYLNLQTAARQIASANAALQQAIAARQLAQVRYEGQVGLYLEVTDAQAALVRAENAQVDAVYNYLVARAQFQTAVGTPVVIGASLTAPVSGTPPGTAPTTTNTTTTPTGATAPTGGTSNSTTIAH